MINEKEIHLREYLRIIKKRRYTVFIFFLITIIVVFAGTFISTPIYEASTQILVEKNQEVPLLGQSYSIRRDPEFYATQKELIKSLNVARRVVKILSFGKTFETYFPEEKEKSRFLLVVSRIIDWPKKLFASMQTLPEISKNQSGHAQEKSPTDIIAEKIKKNIAVTLVKESKLLNISFQSENPEVAQIIANTAATAYIEELMAIQLNSSGHAIKWMTQTTEEVKAKLAKSEKVLQEFVKEQDIVTIEDRIAIVPQQLSDYTARLTEAESDRKELESIYLQIDKIQSAGGDLETIPVLAEDQSLELIRRQLRETEKQVLELSQKYGKKHPTMKKAIDEQTTLNKKKNVQIKKVIKAIRNKYELAKSKENNLRKDWDRAKQETMNLNEKISQYEVLKREVETNQALYKALNIRLKEQGATEKTQNVSVWITELAEYPEFPVKPKKILNILLGVFIGVFGGTGFALFLEYLDNTVKEPDELENKVGQPVFGVIPSFNPKWGKNIEIASYQKPFSPFAESFKSLRSSLLLAAADAPPKSLLVTSMSPEEGKTTTSINLAIAIAQANYKVLLIDADMRRPRIHKIFKLQNTKGLSSYLAGAADEDIIQTITESDLNIVPLSSISHLNIIPSGPIPPNPSELLVSQRLKELFEKAREEFDFIIIDSPPILGATDSLIISKITEGTIVTCRSGDTTFDMINQGMKSFNDIKVNILGMVINDMDIQESKYYYYYGYYNKDSK